MIRPAIAFEDTQDLMFALFTPAANGNVGAQVNFVRKSICDMCLRVNAFPLKRMIDYAS